MSQIVVDQLKSEFLIFYWICPLHLHSSGIELMNAAALLLLFLLNLLLVGRQERLKRSEMVRRLKGIITQLSGKSGLLTYPWKHYGIISYSSSKRSSLFICYTLSGLLFITFFFFYIYCTVKSSTTCLLVCCLIPIQDQVSGGIPVLIRWPT